MTVTVRLFAYLSDCVGTDRLQLDLEAGSHVSHAQSALISRFPALDPWLSRLRTAVNAAYQDADFPLNDGDELALIPPVSGG